MTDDHSATFDIAAMLLYYITDRTQFPGDEDARQYALLARIADAARCGVDYVQLREKDLSVRELESLAKRAAEAVRKNSSTTKLLVNSRVDVSIAATADGVHLRSQGDMAPSQARVVFAKCGKHNAVISCSCHTLEEVAFAESHGADFVVFAPVFEKDKTAVSGLVELRAICKREVAASSRMPVLALGGVTSENAAPCIEAGAAGVAGIRLFQSGDIEKTVIALRKLCTSPVPPNRRHPYQDGH